jgi:uncharacterized RDD family membrane protein YckC
MTWYYADSGRQVGPIEEIELNRLITAGTVRSDTLVWHEGMPSWEPLAAVRGLAAGMMRVRYAGFWIRFLARLIDGVIVGFLNLIVRIPLMMMLGLGSVGFGQRGIADAAVFLVPLIGISALLSVVIGAAYEVYFVSTRGATPGKMVLGLKIVRTDGSAVPPGLALGRYFAQWISAVILMLGYIMAAFDPQKRALHDRICETRVVHAG